ncbi:MAG: hypothetical protein PHP42_10490, partial [Bacteroidota bacterium]|nr:hypothetical protein [Bacteroidota bacterium]
DFFVMNKADRPGADQAVMSIKMILGFRAHDEHSWVADIVKTTASEGKGIEDVALLLARHQAYLHKQGEFEKRRAARLKVRIEEIIHDKFTVDFWNESRKKMLEQKITDVLLRKHTPYDAAIELLKSHS